MMLFQEAKCPACRATWDVPEKNFVRAGESISCRNGCGPFVANAETVLCCLEDADGLLQMPLRPL